MAERAHPDDAGFSSPWQFHLRRGIIPWFTYKRKPYRDAFLWRYRWVSKHCRDKVVLDIPCGMGWGTSKIRGAKSLTGLDISPTAVTEAKMLFGDIAEFREGTMEKLDFAEESFDTVCCLEGIEHIPKAVGEAFICEANQVLKIDGELLLSSPFCKNGQHSGNPYHLHEYQPDELEKLLNPHFTILSKVTRKVGNLDVIYVRCKKR